MIENLKEIFRSRKHQDIMLVGLFLSSIITYGLVFDFEFDLT
jgi:hypothetical protein